jgi:hypothetical protein
MLADYFVNHVKLVVRASYKDEDKEVRVLN